LLTSVPVASLHREGIQNEGSLLGTIWMVVGKPLCLSMNSFFATLTDGGWEHPGHAAAFVCKNPGTHDSGAKSGNHAVESWRNGEVITVSL
jgi:hypothetical protein